VAVIVVIFGPGGVGKGTLVNRLFELVPGLQLSRSWTTRARRPNEAADAYHFVSREAFEDRVAADGFLEWTEFSGTGHLYGTPTTDRPQGPDQPVVILEIEVDGAQQIKRRYPDALLILIAAPSRQAQAERLRARGDDEESVQRRLAVGAAEERVGRRIADHVVVNDDLDRASHELADILRGHHPG
jgi:guanylate kinase